MSRENKLALIIGFGLVLFVGVLISDHLSEANRQVTADLAMAVDPLLDEDDGATLVEFDPIRAPSIEVVVTEPIPLPSDHQLHVVREGETLNAISRLWYGDETSAAMLAIHNNLPDPDRLVPGTRLIMPTINEPAIDTLVAAANIPPLPAAPPAPAAPELDVYTVQPGDTLSQIAQKLLGTSRATPQLFELNRDVIGNMDALQVGMELRYRRPST
ncbi:MAG: LysM domain-containing protein [Phycisphaerales bacterium]|nr:LysM domain-containing protein [Phycisphaerales bacterium]